MYYHNGCWVNSTQWRSSRELNTVSADCVVGCRLLIHAANKYRNSRWISFLLTHGKVDGYAIARAQGINHNLYCTNLGNLTPSIVVKELNTIGCLIETNQAISWDITVGTAGYDR